MDILILNVTPFLLSLLFALPITKRLGKPTQWGWGTALVMAILFIISLTWLPRVLEDGAFSTTIVWVAELGLQFTWYIDGLAVMFMLIVTGIGIAVFLYAGYYLEDPEELARFYAYLSAFTGAMLLLVMAGNLILLFVAWEATSLTSFFLIGFKGAKYEDARIGASRALIITGGGGLALIVGLVLMGTAGGSFEFADLLTSEAGAILRDHAWYPAFTLLIMLGAFTKSAQFPFHFWLPGAMSAPSPASAYLHSATMVKAGVYLLFRMYPALGNTELWQNGLLVIGLITMTIGAFFAIRKRDLKGMLAYTTISMLGTFVALIALPHGEGLKAAALGIIAHALYKGTFFMLAGTVEHATGTRNLDELGGLRRLLPIPTAIAFTVGLSMAGYPPLVGFVGKEYLLDAMLTAGMIPIALVFISAIFNGVAALLFAWDVFISRPDRKYDHFHAPTLGMHIGLIGLAFCSVLFGLLIAPLLDPLLEAVLGKNPHLHLIPTEINAPVILSLLVLVGTPALFFVRPLWMAVAGVSIPSGANMYAGLIRITESLGDFLLKSQNGKLRHYLAVILTVIAGLMLVGGFNSARPLNLVFQNSGPDSLKLTMIVISLGATFASIILRAHLLAVLALGVSGYTIGVLFLLEPAPDVALVQILVETMVTVLTILMIARINVPRRTEAMKLIWRGTNGRQIGVWRDILISSAIGLSVTLFALAAISDRQWRIEQIEQVAVSDDVIRPISDWYLQNSYPATTSTDVVGAVVVDFRGTDTIIEITVFSVAALGLLTLLTLPVGREVLVGGDLNVVMKRVADEQFGDENEEELAMKTLKTNVKPTPEQYRRITDRYRFENFSTPLTRSVARIAFPLALLLSFAQILYGGGMPGDGFTGGMVSGLAVASWYVVFGYFEARTRLKWLHPGRLIVGGLMIALINAGLSLVIGGNFLGNVVYDGGHLPAGLHITTSVFFELAIYCVVFGAVISIMNAISHPRDLAEWGLD